MKNRLMFMKNVKAISLVAEHFDPPRHYRYNSFSFGGLLKVLSKFEKPSTDYIVRFLFAKKSINEYKKKFLFILNLKKNSTIFS